MKRKILAGILTLAVMFSVSTGISANAAADAATLGSIPQNEMSENDVRELPNISDEQMSVEEVSAMEYCPYTKMDYNLNIVSLEDWMNTDVGEYPIDAHSPEWSRLSSVETAAACNMPMEYAKSLTTEELVDYAVNYPFLMDILAYDNISDGVNHLAKKSYLFEELFSRVDCYDELLAEYIDMEINYIEVVETYDVYETNYASELFIETYIGLNYDLLTEDQEDKFVEEYGNKFSNMNCELQESVLSKLFYNAINEKIGVVPESAVPGSVAERFVNFTDTNDALHTSSTLYTCPLCNASFNLVSMQIDGRTAYVYNWSSGGYNAIDIAIMDAVMARDKPSYTKIESASSKYNCHSYARLTTDPGNTAWIEDPMPFCNDTKKWVLWIVPMRPYQAGDRIIFLENDEPVHSAIVESSVDCISKLGHYGVYRTTISEMMSEYHATENQGYIPK